MACSSELELRRAKERGREIILLVYFNLKFVKALNSFGVLIFFSFFSQFKGEINNCIAGLK